MYEFISYQVGDVMTSDPLTIQQEASLSELEAIFEEHDFNGLPVIDGNHRFIGFVTKLDLLKAFAFTNKSKIPPYEEIMTRKISHVQTKATQVVQRGTPLTRVLDKMIETGYKSLPVVEGDRVIGIVAREDILQALRLAAEGKLPARIISSDMEDIFEGREIYERL